jgi:hypothetical protein
MGTAPTVGIAPGALPLFGHTLSLLYDPLGFLTSLPNHGDLVRIQIGPFEAIAVCTPELVRQVLLDDRIFDKAGRSLLPPAAPSQPHVRRRDLLDGLILEYTQVA